MLNPTKIHESLSMELCGLGNLRVEKELGNIILAKDPSVVFLAET